MSNVRVSCLLRALLIVAITPVVCSAQWQVGGAPSFSSGAYGTGTRTDIFYMPISARRLFAAGDLTLVFPFTCIRGDGGVTVLNGTAVRQDAPRPTRPGATTPAPTRGGATPTPARGTTPGTQMMSCGLGDIVVRGRYYLVDEHGWAPTIAVRAHVKAPTANADRGLGTGRPDEGIGIEVSRTLGAGVMALVDGGYTLIGEPAGVDFRNTWWYDVGLGKNVGRAVSLSVFFEEYSAIVPGLVSARDVLAAMTIAAAAGWRVQIAGEFGLSDGAPDHGFTFGASRRF